MNRWSRFANKGGAPLKKKKGGRRSEFEGEVIIAVGTSD